MIRNIALSCLLAVGAFVPTFTVLTPDTAEAKWRRVAAVTSCQVDAQTFDDFVNYGDMYYVTYGTAFRSGNGLSINQHTGQTIGVRCEVPSDTYLRHVDMTEAHVSGYKHAANGEPSHVKACFTWYANGSYSCGASHTLPSGNFNVVVPIGNIWNDVAAMPMITAVLAEQDRLYGVYYTDA